MQSALYYFSLCLFWVFGWCFLPVFAIGLFIYSGSSLSTSPTIPKKKPAKKRKWESGSKQRSFMKPSYLPSLYRGMQGMFASDTYHRTCRSPTAARFHPGHGIPPRWWNCSPLRGPLPLGAAEWCLRNKHTFRPGISDGTCHLLGGWRGWGVGWVEALSNQPAGESFDSKYCRPAAISTSWIISSAGSAELWIH